MTTKPGFELHDVCGEKVIIAQGVENLDFSKMISLNETAAFLWEVASRGEFSAESLQEALCAEYEVEPATAAADIAAMLRQWQEIGLIG